MMSDPTRLPDRATIADDLVLDGNAVGGLLIELFGREMTIAVGECAYCGNVAALAELRVFSHAPGVVMRCAACGQVVMRIVRTPDRLLLDARGAARISLPDG